MHKVWNNKLLKTKGKKFSLAVASNGKVLSLCQDPYAFFVLVLKPLRGPFLWCDCEWDRECRSWCRDEALLCAACPSAFTYTEKATALGWNCMGACSKVEKNFPVYIRPGKQTFFFFLLSGLCELVKKKKKGKKTT